MSDLKLRIEEFCKTGSGTTPSRENSNYYADGTIPWVKSGELRENLILGTEETITAEALKKTSLKLVPKGAILLAMYGATIGRMAILGIDATTNQAVCHIIPDEKMADTRFVYRALQQKIPELISQASGGAQPNINQQKIKALEIPLPSLEQQQRIAQVLDAVDSLLGKRREGLKKLEVLLKSVFLEMFGDPVTNPKGWEEGVLGDVIYSAKDGPHVSPKYAEKGIPFLSTRHIRPGKLILEDLKYLSPQEADIHWKKCKPEFGDILYTKGGTTGFAKVVDFHFDFAVWVHIAVLKTNHKLINGLWLENLLNTEYCYWQSQEKTHGIANKDLGLTRMINIKIFIPPLELQAKFADTARKINTETVLLENSLSSLEKLFASLQHQAFNGTLSAGVLEREVQKLGEVQAGLF